MSSTGQRGRGECNHDYDDIDIGGHGGICDFNHNHIGDYKMMMTMMMMITMMVMTKTENENGTSGGSEEQEGGVGCRVGSNR